jgi:hypothetical protein
MAPLPANTIVSTTAEDALLEIVQRVRDLQASPTSNPQNRIIITSFTQNALTGLISVSLSIPAGMTLGPTGVTSNATEVFT